MRMRMGMGVMPVRQRVVMAVCYTVLMGMVVLIDIVVMMAAALCFGLSFHGHHSCFMRFLNIIIQR